MIKLSGPEEKSEREAGGWAELNLKKGLLSLLGVNQLFLSIQTNNRSIGGWKLDGELNGE